MDFLKSFFENKNVTANNTNKNCVVYYVENASEADFEECTKLLEENAYSKRKESYFGACHRYKAYQCENTGVFVNYYKNTNVLTVLKEERCKFFDFSDTLGGVKVKPQISQIHLEDFGMSYAVRLSDGRFILIDGGREFEPDADRLFNCIKEGTPEGKPVIAAWIMTHPHNDHFHCFMPFFDKYSNDVTIERFMYNFPNRDDTLHYPGLTSTDKRFDYDCSPYGNIPLMEERIAKTGAKVYMPHTGQKYIIGDAVLEILSSIDDTIHLSQDVNATSLVIRMELGGQVILWSADASYSDAYLCERYGSYLKSDILQIPHHGFGMGDAKKEIESYELIMPETCFIPVSDYNAFSAICIHKPSAKHIMMHMDIAELITGEETRTITLPYTPPKSAKNVLKEKAEEGLKAAGSKAWIFSDLDTSDMESFEYSILNISHSMVNLNIEMYFEDPERNLKYIYYTLPSQSIKNLNIIGEEVNSESLFFNWMSLKTRGIPQNCKFAVRFLSDIPVVITNKKYKESYRA